MGDEVGGEVVEVEVDLFGRPVQPLRDPRGRPSYRVTDENRLRVMVRVAAGWTQAAIAEEIGCSEPTLRKHFFRELQNGALLVEGQLLDVLMQRARQGHAASIEKLQQRIDRAAARRPAARAGAPEGKKAALAREASEPSDDWADVLGDRAH